MKLLRQGLVWIVCGAAASTQALADELAAPQLPPSTSAAKAMAKPLKPARPGSSQAGGLDEKFSNPYAPPEGAGKATGARNFPATGSAGAVDPKGGMSFTYKWHATNEPFDPYWQLRHNEYGPDGPGNTFLGGLKLGF
jgi:hypothetical protein